ncbi:MAG TPA: hypothetical protein VFK70_17815 [Vicinamibacteria bacterium]|nr:hypothetical protein [Vicinamibacteria bacterium]
MTKWSLWRGAAVALLLGAAVDARAMSLEKVNLVRLLRHADAIVVGNVQRVSDGVGRNGLPYTEITVAIEESLRGDLAGAYTFRQFGLLNPRRAADGARTLLPAPDAMPRYAAGERALLFLAPAARITGLRSTYGLGAGKFTFGPGRVENGMANAGLLAGVSVEASLKTGNDTRLLGTEVGAVNPEDFMSFVRRAVGERWVETCRMWDAPEGRGCGQSRPAAGETGRRPATAAGARLSKSEGR